MDWSCVHSQRHNRQQGIHQVHDLFLDAALCDVRLCICAVQRPDDNTARRHRRRGQAPVTGVLMIWDFARNTYVWDCQTHTLKHLQVPSCLRSINRLQHCTRTWVLVGKVGGGMYLTQSQRFPGVSRNESLAALHKQRFWLVLCTAMVTTLHSTCKHSGSYKLLEILLQHCSLGWLSCKVNCSAWSADDEGLSCKVYCSAWSAGDEGLSCKVYCSAWSAGDERLSCKVYCSAWSAGDEGLLCKVYCSAWSAGDEGLGHWCVWTRRHRQISSLARRQYFSLKNKLNKLGPRWCECNPLWPNLLISVTKLFNFPNYIIFSNTGLHKCPLQSVTQLSKHGLVQVYKDQATPVEDAFKRFGLLHSFELTQVGLTT